MWTGTELPLAQWNILSWVSLGSKGTFHRALKWRALRRTRRVSSVSDPGSRNSGMAPAEQNRVAESSFCFYVFCHTDSPNIHTVYMIIDIFQSEL